VIDRLRRLTHRTSLAASQRQRRPRPASRSGD
jgi:hypothetical protein